MTALALPALIAAALVAGVLIIRRRDRVSTDPRVERFRR